MKSSIILWIACGFMLITGGVFLYKTLTIKPKVEYQHTQGNIPTGNTVKQPDFVDDSGEVHSVFEIPKENTKSRKDIRDRSKPLGMIDTAAMLLNLARKEIISVREQLSTTQARALKAERKVNELNQVVYYYKDKYVDLAYTPPLDTTSQGTFDFTYNGRVTVTDYTKRDKILGLKIGAKRSYTDIVSEDPRTTINGYRALQLKRQEPFFGLRGQAVGNYNPETHTFGVGTGVRVDFGRLSLQGNYLFYPVTGNWRPSVNANYDIIRL